MKAKKRIKRLEERVGRWAEGVDTWIDRAYDDIEVLQSDVADLIDEQEHMHSAIQELDGDVAELQDANGECCCCEEGYGSNDDIITLIRDVACQLKHEYDRGVPVDSSTLGKIVGDVIASRTYNVSASISQSHGYSVSDSCSHGDDGEDEEHPTAQEDLEATRQIAAKKIVELERMLNAANERAANALKDASDVELINEIMSRGGGVVTVGLHDSGGRSSLVWPLTERAK